MVIMPPQLTSEMITALNSGGDVRVVHPDTKQEFVLLDADTYDKVMAALAKDDLVAIEAGIADMEAGRFMSIEESEKRTEETLRRFKK